MSSTDGEDPRARFRILPTPDPVETDDLATEEAVEPVPAEIAHSQQRAHLRLVTEAGG
ncbi:hypothetical protein [Smaragdicoccus niigatensis]|uniref:hypothetical protein n=1 Tax=Smaragdicoccus niigatensis TaxID=359359 RepID=UPI0003667664|nr:hypothetical protein [Smaragdicoccus niigatensis]